MDWRVSQVWRKRGKYPLTPNETAFILQSLSIPTDTNIYLAAGDGLMEIEGLISVYTSVVTKSSLRNDEDFTSMHGNTKVALDYYGLLIVILMWLLYLDIWIRWLQQCEFLRACTKPFS